MNEVFLPYVNRLSRCRCGSGAIALRGVAHDHAYDAAGQDDLEIVSVLQVGDEKSENESHCQTEQNAQRHGVYLAGKNSGCYSGDQSLERRTKDDSHYLRSYSGRKPT